MADTLFRLTHWVHRLTPLHDKEKLPFIDEDTREFFTIFAELDTFRIEKIWYIKAKVAELDQNILDICQQMKVLKPSEGGRVTVKLLLSLQALPEFYEERKKDTAPQVKMALQSIVERWSISRFGCSFDSTNPKDHIYGLLGITGPQIEPEYGDSKSMGQVCYEYGARWLALCDVLRGHVDMHEELWLLDFAGIGHNWEEYPEDLPSWAPNIRRKSNFSGLVGDSVSETTCPCDYMKTFSPPNSQDIKSRKSVPKAPTF